MSFFTISDSTFTFKIDIDIRQQEMHDKQKHVKERTPVYQKLQ